jgi:hypothetical protein
MNADAAPRRTLTFAAQTQAMGNESYRTQATQEFTVLNTSLRGELGENVDASAAFLHRLRTLAHPKEG